MKALIVGLGSIGQRHARNLRTLLGSDLQLLACRRRGLPHVITDAMTIDASRSIEDAYGLQVFDDLTAALAERPDVVIVANPSSLHLDTARTALRAGCHVFVEKPLSHSEDGLDRLVGEVERSGLVGAVGFQLRFHPVLARLREWLQAERIGRVLSVRAEMIEFLPDAHPYEDYRQSYAARADLGGGVALCFSHEFDYLQWIFGAPRSISAVGGRIGDLEMSVEDTLDVVMDCGTVEGRLPVHVHLSFVERPRSRRCVVAGTAGSIHVDLNAATIERHGVDGGLEETESFAPLDRNRLFLDELEHFLRAVRSGGAPAVGLREGAVSVRMALAARTSAMVRQEIELPA